MNSEITSASKKARKAAAMRRYYLRNKEKVKSRVASWQAENPEKTASYKAKNGAKTRHSRILSMPYQLARLNLKRCRSCKLIRHRDEFSPAGAGGKNRLPDCRPCRNEMLATDPTAAINRRIRSMFRSCVKKGGLRTFGILGYSPKEVIAHLEKQFLPRMGWHNIKEWHIDHIVPLSAFVFSGPDDPEIKRAWALSNLRPLWAKDNLRKSDKRMFLL